jgi:ubiquinone/menaquinone biosynthesis C-methylase UbiE
MVNQYKISKLRELLQFWNARALPYEKYYHWRMDGVTQVLERVAPLLTERSGSSIVVDLGCGPGIVGLQLPVAIDIIGLDFSDAMVRKAKRRLSEVVLADINRLPLKSATVDFALCFFVIDDYTRESKIDILIEINRILKVNGYLFLVDYSPGDGWMGNLRTAILHLSGRKHNPLYLEDLSTLSSYMERAKFRVETTDKIETALTISLPEIEDMYSTLSRRELVTTLKTRAELKNDKVILKREFLFLIARKLSPY